MAKKMTTSDRLCGAMTDWAEHLRACPTCHGEVKRKAGGEMSLCWTGVLNARIVLFLVGRQAEEFRAEITEPLKAIKKMARKVCTCGPSITSDDASPSCPVHGGN